MLSFRFRPTHSASDSIGASSDSEKAVWGEPKIQRMMQLMKFERLTIAAYGKLSGEREHAASQMESN